MHARTNIRQARAAAPAAPPPLRIAAHPLAAGALRITRMLSAAVATLSIGLLGVAATAAATSTTTSATPTTTSTTAATTTSSASSSTTTTTTSTVTTAPQGGESAGGSQTTSTQTVEGGTSTTEAEAGESGTQTTSMAGPPEALSQHPQRSREARSGKRRSAGHERSGGHRSGAGTGGTAPGSRRSSGGEKAPAPGRIPGGATPPLPLSLRAPISGVPAFFIEAFSVPPFLLPIYQAAGIAYGVPWQVLAAINEVETDYGRDLNVSSAGAEGWMQFLPAEWRQYGVDATGSGYEDPYNPADAIFAAARYLAAAGGSRHIRAAVYSYNHSQAYVASVMLRAKLLGGMPPDLLGAIESLAEARFPVHAPSHFADGFAKAPGGTGTLAGTTIYSESEAPAIAVQDATVVAIGQSRALGRYVKLRDAYGDTYTYADLGSVASLYPVLAPRERIEASARVSRHPAERPPTGPATAGAQSHSPVSAAAVASGFAFGAAPKLESAPAQSPAVTAHTPPQPPREAPAAGETFAAGPEQVTLRTLQPGVHVIAGTIIGHLPAGPEAHMLFQIRPAGAGAPLIDPKPILDGWVALEDSAVFKAKGENPFLATSPTAGQALLESKSQLEQQVLRDRGIRIYRCGRADIESGRVDRRVLATLELLSVSGLHPTVSRLICPHGGSHTGLHGYARGEAVDISAVGGVPISGNTAPGGIADLLERKLMTLQGTMKPAQIAGPIDYPGAKGVVTLPSSRTLVHVSFASPRRDGARVASAGGTELTPEEWVALVARLGQIPAPTVASAPAAAAIPDGESSEGPAAQAGEREEEAGGR